jgi:hypothetical protein
MIRVHVIVLSCCSSTIIVEEACRQIVIHHGTTISGNKEHAYQPILEKTNSNPTRKRGLINTAMLDDITFLRILHE